MATRAIDHLGVATPDQLAYRRSSWTERRDPRQRVLIRARLRAGGLPAEVCIRDISARGIMLLVPAPPQRGTIVEILDLYAPVIGQVVWTNGHRCGISLRGRISVSAAISSTQVANDRRQSATIHEIAPRRPVPPAQTLSLSREAGAMIQYTTLVIGGMCAAFAIGLAAYENLSQAFDPVRTELSG